VLVAWGAIVAPLLVGISTLGGARAAIDSAAAMHFAPDLAGKGATIAMSTGTAVLVLVAWAVVFLRAGEWWTRRVDA
jgi:hypothetical protein